jgi:L-asparaginase II
MRFAWVRSGLAESYDDVSAVAVDGAGKQLFSSGDPDAEFFYRSAIKPLQALAARRTGLDLPPEHLAVTCASHTGYPVHLSTVRAILSDAGLTEADLRTTSGRPSSRIADSWLIAAGDTTKRPILHNCSGKHAGWLAACAHAGWDTETYLEESHPLQQSILDVVHEYTGIDPTPVGVDGCGAPTLRGSVRGLATAFQRIDTAEELAPIASAMSRFGPLLADNIDDGGRVAVTWGGPQKGGAEGSFAMARSGIGIATKSHSGNITIAIAGALEVASKLGMLTDAMRSGLEPQIAPPVIGAGRVVGQVELVAP